jgi:Ca2+:H+ antiporter
VALLAEFLVGTIESVRATFGLIETFVGIIVVAIIGNRPSTRVPFSSR